MYHEKTQLSSGHHSGEHCTTKLLFVELLFVESAESGHILPPPHMAMAMCIRGKKLVLL